MTVSEQIFQLYQRFYAQRSVLAEAPQLTIDVDHIGKTEFPCDKAFNELSAVSSYLIGRADIRQTDMAECMKIINKAYSNQPFWRDLLESYLAVLLDKEEQELLERGYAIQEEAENLLDQINQADYYQKAAVDLYASKVKEAKFPVDAHRLIANFFKMSRSDAEKAWQVLITNPAYFSPIMANGGMGQPALSPEQAKDANSRLGQFLKKLTG